MRKLQFSRNGRIDPGLEWQNALDSDMVMYAQDGSSSQHVYIISHEMCGAQCYVAERSWLYA